MSPMRGEITKNQGPSGLCEVRVVKDGVKLVTPAGDLYHITQENIPEWITIIPGKEMFFGLDTTESRLRFLQPYNLANIALRFMAFAPRKEGIPTPNLQKGGPVEWQGKRWYAKDRLTMVASLGIAVGEFEGMNIPYFLDYLFKPQEGGWAGWIGTQEQVRKLENFLYLFGVDFATDSVAFSENVLPAFEALLLERDGFAMGNIEEGRLVALFKPPVGYTIPSRAVVMPAEEGGDGEEAEG